MTFFIGVGLDIDRLLTNLIGQITPDQVKLDGVLKELGLYTVKVQFHPEISTDLKVWVVPAASN
ncbi:MAG: 50S ribosomal L9 C-terminal domain-containing protein [Pirellula sp.]